MDFRHKFKLIGTCFFRHRHRRPDGGTEEKPVGTVFIGFATPSSVHTVRFLNPYDRPTFKEITSQQALEILRRHLHP